MALKSKILGIDIGSVSAGVAVLDDSYRILYTSYKFHKGQIVDSLRSMLSVVDPEELMAIAYTSSSPEVFHQGKKIDNRVAFISAARHFSPDLQALLIIGAEKFGLATFNEKGEYLNYRSNSSCAAGTGNFLDQQAERLNLKNIREFSRLASGNTGNFPKIASRCAVFAKTDLIHVQQEGYSLGEICDGLSYGLAKNIVDTVFQGVTTRNIIAAGGVALNKAVIRHIEKLTEKSITVDEHAPLYGAIGAALDLITNREEEALELRKFEDFIYTGKKVKKYQYPPLKLKLSSYPDFDAHEYYIFHPACLSSMKDVEVDAYTDLTKDCSIKAYLGIDIGSTSTKAILIDHSKNVIAGFYTRTSGQPLQAVQVLFEAICDFEQRKNVRFVIVGAGTTGSGRKFTGQIIGADSIIDEITAHARAACELNPDTDTIIEIGGQDSKFTILNQGMVTFSVMNNVCAAGTGSFIEEQAKRLNCPLQDYSRRVEEVHSPMASDRCTVFMERDLNHYLMSGYSADEILAAVLHATRENYLTKVAVRGYIGKTIFFQGATAKNKALVAAFEQALEKPIMVSRYCHLTGALGVALELHDNKLQSTRFKGLDLYRKTIPVRSEVCELCTNHCKLKVAEVDGRTEAYGFLCGRDYDADRYVKSDSGAFQLLRQRDTIFRFRPKTTHARLTLGIPAGLHLFEEVPFWREFFDLLSIRTVTSEDYHDAVRNGKKLAGAEFCAPIAAMHGHVDYLKDRVDYIFLPVYLEETQESKMNKQYCYYTQFVSSVIATQTDSDLRKKLLSPLLKSNHSELFIRIELFRMLRKIGLGDIGLLAVSHAWEQAMKKFNRQKELWHSLYPKEIHDRKDLHIMLLGRPYTVLSTAMNSSIPDIISKTGISTFFMDMLPYRPKKISRAEELVKTIKWKFASKILYAAEVVAKTDNCYPVLVTSFKCTPDSFVIEYFKEIMNAYEKPYLILQLDEHDSTVGYETRIEAGIRAFRNHRSRQLAGKGPTQPDERHGKIDSPDQHHCSPSLAGNPPPSPHPSRWL